MATFSVAQGRNSQFYSAGGSPRTQQLGAILNVLQAAAASAPSSISRVEVFSGQTGRSTGTKNHPGGRAVDIHLYDAGGNLVKNYIGKQGVRTAEDKKAYQTYEQFAQQARQIQMRDYPQLGNAFRWGGYFAGGVNPLDLMHFDLSGELIGPQTSLWKNGLATAGLPRGVSLGAGALNGLPQTAAAPPGALPEAPQRTLQKGDEGMDVAALQMRLQNAGLYKGPIDGKYGAGTAEAVRATERAANLRIDKGVAGPQVQTALAGNLPRFPGNPSDYPGLGSAVPSYIPPTMANAPQRVGNMGTEQFGFGAKLPPAALFPSGGPTPPMPIPTPYMGNGPGRAPAGPAGPLPQRPFSSPYVSDAGGQPISVGDVQRGDLPPVYSGNGPGRAPTGPAQVAMSPTLGTKDDAYSPPGYNPFSGPQPWGAVADQSVQSLPGRLTGTRLPSSPSFGFAQAGGAVNAMNGPDVTGGRNLALMGRAPVNMANAAGANVTTPALLRDQQQAQGFGNFLRSIFGGSDTAKASVPSYRYDPLSSAGTGAPAMPSIPRQAPATISPQQFQQRFAPMGSAAIPQDVTYRTASLSPVLANTMASAPKTISQASFNDRFSPAPTRYDPLSSAYTYKTISVPGVTFAPAAPAKVTPAGGESALSNGTALGGALMGAGSFGVGAVAEPVKPKPTMTQRLARVAVPVAASAVMGPVGGLLARGIMGLAQGGPLAQRVGQAISYANAQPRSNSYAASPFTPAGFTAPNFNPASGGSIYAYNTTAPGVGSYINSAGRTINYNVNADQAVYGSGGGLGGFRP